MDPIYVFFIQLAGTFILMSSAASWWIMPRLRSMPQNQALAIALLPGAIRYFGTLLLVPALAPTSHPDLVGAWGDVLVSALAFAGVVANRADSGLGRPLAWAYAIVGGADMVITFIKGLQTGLWAQLSGGWTFVVAVFPAVGIGLAVTFLLLLRPSRVPATATGTAIA
jgi:hypothetical protein